MLKKCFSIVFIILFALSNIINRKVIANQDDIDCQIVINNAPKPSEAWLVVLVHGIMNIQPHLNLSNIIRFMRDQIEDSIYVKAVEIIRKDSYFHQFSAIQGLGLQTVNTQIVAPGASASAFAYLYDMIESKNQLHPKNCYFYTFGWSGLLSSTMRYLEAKILYLALADEVARFKAQSIDLKICIIGYSHGGNLCINLGSIHDQTTNPTLHVERLILVGVPLIPENYQGIASPLFRSIYHVYSPGDRVQPIDCLSGGILFSSKKFKPNSKFTLPANLKQIEFRVKRIAHWPATKKVTTNYHKRRLRNADPGHTELWSFGWVNAYRPHIPLYPLPAACYIGYVINAIEQTLAHETEIIVDIRPFEEKMLLTSRTTGKTCVQQFFNEQALDQFRIIAERYKPIEFSKEISDHKVEIALQQATEAKYQERNKRYKPRRWARKPAHSTF